MTKLASNTIEVRLDIGAAEYVKLYQGIVKDVAATAVDGRRIQFPARILQPFVGHFGVRGRFLIHFDEAGKFLRIERLG